MERPLHVIDVTVSEGLLDMIALGNIIEFAISLDLRTYENVVVDQLERQEIEASMTRYRSLIAWYCKNFGLLIDGTWINPTYLFKLRLISFAATVCQYFAQEHATTQQQSQLKGITPLLVKKMFRRHIQMCWTDLLPAFERLLTDPSHFLYHTSPPFRIVRKTDLHLLQENLADRTEDRDFAGAPIYPPADNPPVPRKDAAQIAAEKRGHIPTGSPNSPSQQKVNKRRK